MVRFFACRPEEVEDPTEAAAAARAPAMAQPPSPFSFLRPLQPDSARPMAPGGTDSKPGTSSPALASTFRFHFRPRPTLPDVYFGTGQSEPGTRALPPDYRPTSRRGTIQVVSGAGSVPLAET